MKKLQSTLVNMALVLTGTAILTGGLLAFVNAQTTEKIQDQKKQELDQGIKDVVGASELTVSSTDTVTLENNKNPFIVYQTTDAQGQPLGVAVESSTDQGFGGKVRILVGFDNEGVIKGYTVLEHAETPGLGAKAGEWFQKDSKGCIIGKNVGKGPLMVTKGNENVQSENKVDAITAATITSRAFLGAVNEAYEAYKQQMNGTASSSCGKADCCQEKADCCQKKAECCQEKADCCQKNQEPKE